LRSRNAILYSKIRDSRKSLGSITPR